MKLPASIQTVNGREVDTMALSPLCVYVTATLIVLCAVGVPSFGILLTGVWITLSWVLPVSLYTLLAAFRPESPRYHRRYAR